MLGYLGLGSNVGDRESHLTRAIQDLAAHWVTVDAVSSLYETEPVGEILDQPDFLNAAVRVRTALGPGGASRGFQGDRGRARPDLRRPPPQPAADRHRRSPPRRSRDQHRTAHAPASRGDREALRARAAPRTRSRSSPPGRSGVALRARAAWAGSAGEAGGPAPALAGRQVRRPSSHSAGKMGGVRPGKSVTIRFAISPQGLASTNGRRSSKLIRSRTLGAS